LIVSKRPLQIKPQPIPGSVGREQSGHRRIGIINKAWRKAGMKGSISVSLVNKVRSDLGLAGNIRPGPKKSAGKTKAAGVHAKSRLGNRERMLAEMESRIDRLIFDLLEIGGIEKAEDALRAARRVVVRAQKA
jgi:hypothetical protein